MKNLPEPSRRINIQYPVSPQRDSFPSLGAYYGHLQQFPFHEFLRIFGVGVFSFIKESQEAPAFGTPDDGLFNLFSQSQSLSLQRRRDIDQVHFYLSQGLFLDSHPGDGDI